METVDEGYLKFLLHSKSQENLPKAFEKSTPTTGYSHNSQIINQNS